MNCECCKTIVIEGLSKYVKSGHVYCWSCSVIKK